MTGSVEHLVSLTWDQPLPTAVVALTLRPTRMTLIAPRVGRDSARRIQDVLERHGIAVSIRLGDEATDLDAGDAGERMRDVILQAIDPSAEVVLDYTGGSKLMAAAARLALEPDGEARAVYLDVRSDTLRWDDGREQPAASPLDITDVGALHGSVVLGTGGAPLSEHEDARDVLKDAPRILEGARAGVRRLYWKAVVDAAEAAHGEQPPAAAAEALRCLADDIIQGRAQLLPMTAGNEGDWLELVVADAVERALAERGAEATVRLSVEGRHQQASAHHRVLRKAHPTVQAVVDALRRYSVGADSPEGVQDAVDDLLQPDTGITGAERAEIDFEIDVVALRGHRIHGLSCYAGREPHRLTWKSPEIARRVVQLGGDHAQPGFVCLLDEPQRAELQARLPRSAPGARSVTVFGLQDLLAWTAAEPSLTRLATFLGLVSAAVPRGLAELPQDVEHDLLVTVGGSPLPVLQAILAHRSQRPLLLHAPETASPAARIAEVLAKRGITAVCVQVADGFRNIEVDAALRQLPPSPAIDITGGTKVLASCALLRHARNGDLATATYVDGHTGALRSLAAGIAPRALPADVTIEELLHLRGWQVASSRRPDPTPLSSASGPAIETLDRESALDQLASMAATTAGPDAEVLEDVDLAQLHGVRREHVDLLVRRGTGVTVGAVAWLTTSLEVTEAAWPLLLTAADALGDYARVIVVAPLDDISQRRVERHLQRRSAGASLPRVLGRTMLSREPDEVAELLLDATRP